MPFWTPFNGQIELATSGGGRSKGDSGRDVRAIALLLSNHRDARREELALVIYWSERVRGKKRLGKYAKTGRC